MKINKLSELLFALLDYYSVIIIKNTMGCSSDELLSFISGEEIPSDEQLRMLSEKFRLNYNSLKEYTKYKAAIDDIF